jgi:ABC-type antimicrobial peptide transport system permease subunit
MDEIIDLEVADRHQQMMLLGVFAGLALALSTLGLYGLLAYAVAQRSREIGLRIALGATAREVVTMVAAARLALAAIGVAVGIAGGWAATRAMTSVLYGVRPTDPSTFAIVAALLGRSRSSRVWSPPRARRGWIRWSCCGRLILRISEFRFQIGDARRGDAEIRRYSSRAPPRRSPPLRSRRRAARPTHEANPLLDSGTPAASSTAISAPLVGVTSSVKPAPVWYASTGT